MTISVQGADGLTHVFPEDTPPEVIQKVMGGIAPKQVDKYEEAANRKISSLENKGVLGPIEYGNRYLKGATLGFSNDALAAIQTPMQMIEQGTANPAEAWRFSQALQKAINDRASKDTGITGAVAELAGGLGTGVGAAKNGLTLIKEGQTLLPRIGASAAEGAAYGGISGSNEGEGLERVGNAIKGVGAGAALGGALPAAGGLIGLTKAGTISNIMSQIDPEGAARAQIGREVMRSGKSADEIMAELARAKTEGQQGYTLAEAMGPRGITKTAGLMQSPSEMQAKGSEFLIGRQNEAGRRLTGFTRDAFDAPDTMQQWTAAKTAARDAEANQLYDAARQGARPVDLTDTLMKVEDLRDPAGVLSGATAAQSAAPAGVERAAKLIATEGLGNTSAADFNLILDRKRQIGDLMQEAQRAGRGYEASQLAKIMHELDAALENASGGYRAANDTFARRSRAIEAAGTGRQAATSGNSIDTIDAFNKLEPDAQQGFRVGYADKTVEPWGNRTGGNKAEDLLGPYVSNEIDAFAATPQKAELLKRQAQREKEMHQTLTRSLGGSPTARHLSEAADSGIDPRTFGVFANLAKGEPMAALGDLGHVVGNKLTGNTEAVRNEALRILLGLSAPPTQYGVPMKLLQKAGYANNRAAPTDLKGILSDAEKDARFWESAKTKGLRGLLSTGANYLGGM